MPASRLGCSTGARPFLLSAGRFADAEPIFERALKIAESRPGKNAANSAGFVNSLAKVCWQLKRYQEAETYYRRCLTMIDDLPNNEEILVPVLANLAAVCTSMERFAEAEALLKQSLELGEATLGENHRETATVYHNLAGLYRTMGRNEEAER